MPERSQTDELEWRFRACENNLKRIAHCVTVGTTASLTIIFGIFRDAASHPSTEYLKGIVVLAACCGTAFCAYLATLSIEHLDPSYRQKLRETFAHWNFLIAFDDGWCAQFLSALPLGLMIFCWWIGFVALSVLRSNFSLGLENVYFGAGILSLASITRAMSIVRPDRRSFRVFRRVRITAEDIVGVFAIAAGLLVYWGVVTHNL